MTLPTEILDLLRCPSCKGQLRLLPQPAGGALECSACRLRYEIRDGIPIMLIDEAAKF